MTERPMTEDEMQACLDAGDLPGTPSEARAIEHAFALGLRRCEALREALQDISDMKPSEGDQAPYEARKALAAYSDATTHEGTRSR